MNLLIKNALVVDCNHSKKEDIYIENGLIKEIAGNLNYEGVEVIDAKGLTVMPAFIDTHAHFRDPGLTYKEDLETGSKAAVRGGYTGVCLMANTSPICSDIETLKYVREKSKEIGLVDVHQVLSITDKFQGKTLEHLNSFIDDNELKAISDDGVGVMDSSMMYKALLKAKENNWVVMSHAEDHNFSKIDMRIAENSMTIRDVYLAKETGGKLHMAHVSTIEAIEEIVEAKKKGYNNITCEVTPHHIALTNDVSNYRVNPPIREKKDVLAIYKAIKEGYVDAIGTDHAPHTFEDKEKGSPGMVGLETAFPICYTKLVKENIIDIQALSKLMSRNPAEILGMNKGELSIGKDGDLVLVNLDKKIVVNSEEFHSKGKNTPFEGMEFYGEVLMTIKGGKVVFQK